MRRIVKIPKEVRKKLIRRQAAILFVIALIPGVMFAHVALSELPIFAPIPLLPLIYFAYVALQERDPIGFVRLIAYSNPQLILYSVVDYDETNDDDEE